jgi:hypothetical protein
MDSQFFMTKLSNLLCFVFVLLAVHVRGAAFLEGAGSGGAPGVVTIAPGANLAAVNWQNNTSYQLGEGAYTVGTVSILNSNLNRSIAHPGWQWINKTGITLLGISGQSIVDGRSGLGEILWVSNCSRIHIEGVEFRGYTNHNNTQLPIYGSTTNNNSFLWANINVYRTEHFTYRNNRMIGGADHGLQDKGAEVDLFPATVDLSTNNIIVENSYFYDIGGIRTNSTGITTGFGYDGAAIVPTGWTIRNNHFDSCLRGIEPYNEADSSARVFYNCVVQNNTFRNMVDFAISTEGSTNMHGAVWEGNVAINDPTFSWHGTNYGVAYAPSVGFKLNGGRKNILRNNTVRGYFLYGIYAENTASFLDECSIVGNHAIDINQQAAFLGIGFQIGSQANTAAGASAVRKLYMADNVASGSQVNGFRLSSGRDVTFVNNVAYECNQSASVAPNNSSFNFGTAGNSSAQLTNWLVRNCRSVSRTGNPYGFAFQDNIASLEFSDWLADQHPSFVANEGVTNLSGFNVVVKGSPRTFTAVIDLPSIGVNSQFTTNFTATGATTNDVVTSLRLPAAQFYASGNTTNLIFNAWPSNDTVYVKFSNNDAVTAADAPSCRFIATLQQVQIRGQ